MLIIVFYFYHGIPGIFNSSALTGGNQAEQLLLTECKVKQQLENVPALPAEPGNAVLKVQTQSESPHSTGHTSHPLTILFSRVEQLKYSPITRSVLRSAPQITDPSTLHQYQPA